MGRAREEWLRDQCPLRVAVMGTFTNSLTTQSSLMISLECIIDLFVLMHPDQLNWYLAFLFMVLSIAYICFWLKATNSIQINPAGCFVCTTLFE